MGNDRLSLIKMKGILNKFVDRLAKKESLYLDIPSFNNDVGGAEKKWEQVEEIIKVMELEISINKVFYEGKDDEISLDENWKSVSSTYIAHIRAVVSRANMPEIMRERILLHLNKLQLEIDRNRTRLSSLTEVFLSLTEAAGKGANNLAPAVRLFEKLAGAFSGARTSHTETRLGFEPQARLPPPETLGLTDLPPDKIESSDPTA